MKDRLTKQKEYCTRDVTLKQLRVLAAIARTGKITTAASELGVTPPAVTLQLKLLEESSGLALFDRTRQGLSLTEAGRFMLAAQLRIDAALAECCATFQEMKGLSRGRVSVGIISTAKYFAPRALAAFATEHPSIDVELRAGNRQDTIGALSALHLDMAIMGTPPDTIDAEHSVIGEHPFIIVAPVGHPLTAENRVPLSALTNEKFLLREVGSGTRTLLERIFAQSDLELKGGTEFGSNETIKQAVMAGLGIAFISAHTVATEITAGWLSVVPVDGLPIMRKWYAVRAKEKHLLPAAAAMWDFLGSKGSGYLPDVSVLHGAESVAAKRRRR